MTVRTYCENALQANLRPSISGIAFPMHAMYERFEALPKLVRREKVPVVRAALARLSELNDQELLGDLSAASERHYLIKSNLVLRQALKEMRA